VAQGSFRVEEYRAAEFAVEAKREHKALIRGETMRWDISGRYLFGSAMRGAKFKTYLSWDRAFFAPPGHEGYAFGDEAPWWGAYRSTSGSAGQGRGKLDDRGEGRGERKLKPSKMFGPRRYQLEATVTDISRQSISARTSTLLHPGEFYLGVKVKERFLEAKKPLEAKVIVARPNGKIVEGVSVAGTLYRREWRSVRKKGMHGATTFVTRPFETAVGTCRLRSAKTAQPCTIALPKAGYYILRLATKDRRGNAIKSAMDLYASGSGYTPWRRDNSHQIELVTDRKSYRVGQVARVMIKSPFPKAHGLLTVERNGIYLQKPLVVKRSSMWVEIPITEELVPNAFVSVMLVRGRMVLPPSKKKKDASDWHHDPGKPAFKVGYIKLPISAQDHRVSLGVKPDRQRYRPGEEAVVALIAKDAKGQPVQAEVTVMVADEGVLSLIGYRTPDPMTIFYAERGLSVRTADNRIQLLSRRLFGEKGKNPGGGGGGHGGASKGRMRKNFVSTPYFAPSVITDAQGRAKVRFTLPDNLTTFRVMAVAVTKSSSFGSGQAKIEVNKPLLLLPALPRFLRVGDKVEAGVVIHNRTGKAGMAQVTAHAKGLALTAGVARSVQIPAGQGREARFTFVAKRPGVATLRFSATLGDHRDAVEVKRDVKLPLVIEHTATMGSTEDKVAEAVSPGDNVRDDVGGLEITLASSAMVGLRGGLEYLLNYPYECLEQSSSRLAAIAIFGPLLEAYALKKPAAAKELSAKLVGRLEKLQRWNGGFSYWPSSSYVSPWASAYTLWVLQQAKKHGLAVSERVLKNGTRYLTRQLRNKSNVDEERRAASLTEKAYIAHVLTALGKRPDAYLNHLYEKRAQLPVFAKALLLEAMAGGKKSDATALAKLERETTNGVHQTGRTARVEETLGGLYEPFFHSSTRSSAMLLAALLATRPEHPLVEKLVAGLIEARKDGRWRNTQETVYALYALHRYYSEREKDVPDFVAKVVLGEKELLEKRFKGRSLAAYRATTPMKSLLGKRGLLGFIKGGTGRLYYSAHLKYARKALPMTPWDEGIFLTRSYERVQNKQTSFNALRGTKPKLEKKTKQLTFKAGEMVRVKLRLVIPQQMFHVAIDDPLPAGLEAVNFNLMTASRTSQRHARGSGSHSRYGRGSWWHTPFYHRQTRDDRVQLFADSIAPGVYTYVYLTRATSLGRFVAPPSHAEQMYAPEVFGRSATHIIEVRE
ncbi:MAG: hypothetical protein JRH20_18635, partial [Deltaproteobacteria bacterium]|nr:hypothetical protein [Deltaproteobacteria bacterium]